MLSRQFSQKPKLIGNGLKNVCQAIQHGWFTFCIVPLFSSTIVLSKSGGGPSLFYFVISYPHWADGILVASYRKGFYSQLSTTLFIR